MKASKIVVLLWAFLLVNSAMAARVAVVVKFPDQTQTRCVTVLQDADAYQALQDADLNAAWSYYGQSLGHGLCGISGTGCPSTNCYCNPNEYWNFYAKQNQGDPWTYSSVGFDGGSSCSDHYCAVDGGMLGFGYGAYGTQPPAYSFNDVCCSLPGDEAPCGTVTVPEIIQYISLWAQGRAGVNDVLALIHKWATG